MECGGRGILSAIAVHAIARGEIGRTGRISSRKDLLPSDESQPLRDVPSGGGELPVIQLELNFSAR